MPQEEAYWRLPPTSQELCLWGFLHDAELFKLHHDRRGRRITFDFELGFPRPNTPAPERATLILDGVTHIEIRSHQEWSGATETSLESGEAELKNHLETIGSDELARLVERRPLDVTEATLRTGSAVILDLSGFSSDVRWVDAAFAGDALICHADGELCTVEKLLEYGSTGWDDWVADNEAKRRTEA